ncbi:hypothetical protein L483_13130 [Pseudomonas putida H8234]|nr:hypothetical protein L483_13130 [Pseudomonas putida H8234]
MATILQMKAISIRDVYQCATEMAGTGTREGMNTFTRMTQNGPIVKSAKKQRVHRAQAMAVMKAGTPQTGSKLSAGSLVQFA